MGRRATTDIQTALRRQLARAAPPARPSPPKLPRPLPKLDASQSILAVDSDNYGPCFLCRDAKHGYWASAKHVERAYRFGSLDEASAACEHVNTNWQGDHAYQPVMATMKVTLRLPNNLGQDVLERSAG